MPFALPCLGGPARAFIARCAGSGELALEAGKILGQINQNCGLRRAFTQPRCAGGGRAGKAHARGVQALRTL